MILAVEPLSFRHPLREITQLAWHSEWQCRAPPVPTAERTPRSEWQLPSTDALTLAARFSIDAGLVQLLFVRVSRACNLSSRSGALSLRMV